MRKHFDGAAWRDYLEKMAAEKSFADLIACPKAVVDPPRREMKLEGKMKRNEMALKSADGKHDFRAFIRQNEEFQENFSIGLVYVPRDDPGEFVLIRYNGQHGGTRTHPHHAIYHIHRILAEDLKAGVKEARSIDRTEEYASFAEAVRAFCRRINMNEQERFFPGLIQRHLFPGEETQL